jgi:phosphoribosylformylglycinamidine synthase
VARYVVDVMPKREILDPQGKAVLGALPRLGFEGVTDVRQGKRFEIEVDGEADDARLADVRRMAETLLANPVIEAAGKGMPVLGICNGFQILCESHPLPGALIRNDHRKFVCRDQRLRIENNRTPWTSAYDKGAEVTIVLKNGEGGYVADADTLDRLEGEGRVVARYLDDNPNGSMRGIAGITNERGNVVGLMPHPEHAVEDLCGPGTDGLGFFTSLAATVLA